MLQENSTTRTPLALLPSGRARAQPGSEPAPLQSDMRHGIASTVAGLGLYGALLLCVMAFA